MTDLTSFVGADTALPVVAVGGADLDGVPSDRRSRRLLRRSSRVLAALRAAGVTGTVALYPNDGSFLGLQTIELYVRTGEGRTFVVVADTYPRGGISGIGEQVVVAVRDPSESHHPGRQFRYGATRVDVDRHFGPEATRTSLLWALRSALAPLVWDEVTAELGKGTRVTLYRAESNGGSGLVVDTTGPAGHVVAHVERGGYVHGMSQRTGSSWSRGEGAFGRFLTAEFRRALGVEDEHEVFGPFMDRLVETAHAYSGLPITDDED